MKNTLIEMYQNDKTLFFTWGVGSVTGGYSGFNPPQFIANITTGQLDNLIQLGWVAITATVATSVSFLVTRLWKKLFKSKSGN